MEKLSESIEMSKNKDYSLKKEQQNESNEINENNNDNLSLSFEKVNRPDLEINEDSSYTSLQVALHEQTTQPQPTKNSYDDLNNEKKPRQLSPPTKPSSSQELENENSSSNNISSSSISDSSNSVSNSAILYSNNSDYNACVNNSTKTSSSLLVRQHMPLKATYSLPPNNQVNKFNSQFDSMILFLINFLLALFIILA
jgi:hypothetical protein